MFKKIVKCCMIFYMLVACSATMAHPHLEVENPKDTFKENVSDDLAFYVLGGERALDKELRVPAVLRYVLTPQGEIVQLFHINQINAQNNTNTLWFQNDKHQTQNAPKKGESSPQAKQEEVKSKTRTL